VGDPVPPVPEYQISVAPELASAVSGVDVLFWQK
jgi:hypothetical protein